MKYIAGGQDYKVLAGQLSEEVNGSGGPTLGEAERTAGEKGQVEVEARGLGQTRGWANGRGRAFREVWGSCPHAGPFGTRLGRSDSPMGWEKRKATEPKSRSR